MLLAVEGQTFGVEVRRSCRWLALPCQKVLPSIALSMISCGRGTPFKPEAGAWDWSQTSRLVIPVENPANEALTLLLRVEGNASRSLTGKVAISPQSAS